MAFFKDIKDFTPSKRIGTHITYRVGGQLYAVSIDMVSEVIRCSGIVPVKDADDAVIGRIELRNRALVVIDMGIRLQGKPITISSKSLIIVVKRDEVKARSGCLNKNPGDAISISPDLSACLLDGVEKVTAIPKRESVAPENASNSGATHGYYIYEGDGETILLPDRKLYYPN